MPPLIDPRNLNDLIEQLREMYFYYTPEWRFSPEDPDPGTALFLIFAEMFNENIKRFNKVPLKNFIAFMNMLNVSTLSAKPAHAFVTFSLTTGAEEPVLIPSGTQVSADGLDGDPIIFETERNILAAPASVTDTYNVSTKQDKIFKINNEKSGFSMFDFSGNKNLQEHSLYLGHTDLFNITETALVKLELINSSNRFKESSICEKMASPDYMEWMYLGKNGWYPFDEVLTQSNKLVLKKNKLMAINKSEREGIFSRWIRCTVKNLQIDKVSDIELDSIGVSTEFYDCDNRGGIEPDSAFYNDIQVDIKGFYPFGEYFAVYDEFYLASQEVFSKKGSTITLKFKLQHIPNIMKSDVGVQINYKDIMKKSDFEEPELPKVSVLKVTWEYWNGDGWVKLLTDREYEEIFYHPADNEKSLVFKCPNDMEETFLGDHLNYWIRARVLNIENLYAVGSVYRSPWLEDLALRYEFSEINHSVDYCITYNNVECKDKSIDVKAPGNLFRPFYSFELMQPAFFMGFDIPPVKGPISIFFSIKQQKYLQEEVPFIEWEYLRGNGSTAEWSALKIIDETNAFTRSGTVTFVGPPNFKQASIFGKERCWIRVVNRDSKFEQGNKENPIPTINGIYMNTTRVIQQESIEQEMLEPAFGEINKEYVLAMAPVISEEVWVNEAGHLTESERFLLLEDELMQVDEIKDEEGLVEEFWVRWIPVDDFLDSEAGERHYVINRSSGRITFGDGKYGKIPPSSGADNIMVKYKIGGGRKGNVRLSEITNLQNSIAFVDEVFNPEPSGGGCEMETLQEAMQRGPQMLKHRNRAVTAEDFEWLAREASQNIAKVKCLPNFNVRGEKETGCVTVVIVPKGGKFGLIFFPELKQQVEKYLLNRAANTIAFSEKIQVIEPVYLEICVHAALVVKDIDAVTLVEKEAVNNLDNFLNPLTGNYHGHGWEIGQQPHISMFYTLLKSIKTVNHVEKVSMEVHKVEDGKRTEMNPNYLDNLPHGLVISGKHKVVVNLL